jgi:hypothetical protein
MTMPHKVLSPTAEEGFAETENNQRSSPAPTVHPEPVMVLNSELLKIVATFFNSHEAIAVLRQIAFL